MTTSKKYSKKELNIFKKNILNKRDDVLKDILELAPLDIIYVSCMPATLARDLKEIIKGGYKLKACQSFDMFPQTYHMETLTWLSLH